MKSVYDSIDAEWINSINFCNNKNSTNVNRYLRIHLNIYLHDLVISPEVREHYLNLKNAIKRHRSNGVVDHINRNSFDNRRENLRYATIKQNSLNKAKSKTFKGRPTTSKFIGVCFDKSLNRGNKRWLATYKDLNGKKIMKNFLTESEAVAHRDLMMSKMYPNEIFNLNVSG